MCSPFSLLVSSKQTRGSVPTWLWACVLVCLFAACSSPQKVALFSSEPPPKAKDYQKVLHAWTRQDKLYHGLDTRLFVTATFHAPAFRRAFAVAFPEIYGHGGNITRRELVDLSDDIEQFHNFFVTLYTAKTAWADLDRADSIWRLHLENDQNISVEPASIIPVTIDANLRAVYAYLGDFDSAYLVRFPHMDVQGRPLITPSTTRLVFRLSSALGSSELIWELIPSNEPGAK